LSAQLTATWKALSDEKSARSDVAKALAEEKVARLAVEQALKDADKAKNKLAKVLEMTHATYTVTQDKLASKSKELDDVVIWEQKANTLRERAEEKLIDAEKKLAAVEAEKNQGLLLESARQALSKREDSFVLMISMTVANAMALPKNHLPDLDVEILCKDFTVDEAESEVLTNGAYDVAHEFALSYDFSSLTESEDNDSPRNVQFFSCMLQ
jgi:transcription initiation factor IIF auxiliary subunit